MPQQLTFSYGKTLAICISARNNTLYVKQQLQNLALLEAPVLERIEIIVVDNDSTDGTSTAIKMFEGRVPFQYVSNTENLSQDNSFIFALNQATAARTKYIWMLDARNVVRTEHLVELLDLLDNNECGLIYLDPNEEAKKTTLVYVDVDDYLQIMGINIINTSRNILRADLIRGYNPTEFGAGTGIPAVPLLLHVSLAAKQNFIFTPPMYEDGMIDFLAEATDPVRTYVKNLLAIYDRYEDKVTSISPATTMKLRRKIAEYTLPLFMRVVVLRRSIGDVDGRVSRGIFKENIKPWVPPIIILKRCFSPKLWGRFFGFIFGIIRKLLTFIAAVITMLICNTYFTKAYNRFKISLTTFRFRHRVRVGGKCVIEGPVFTAGNKYIYIGENFTCKPGLHLECINTGSYTPKIHISDNVKFERNVRIDSIKEVRIGNNVLVGQNVYITDYQMGKTDSESLNIVPASRGERTKGSITIGDNVIIGPNVTILSGVTIGKGAVIGAGAVVTRNIPDASVAVGVPARVKQ